MSPTQGFHKRNGRKVNFLLNNPQNIPNNLIFNNNMVFEPMPDLQPILNFDNDEDIDLMDGNVPSSNTPSNGDRNHNNSTDKKPKKKEFKVTEALVRKQAPTFLLIESLIWNLCQTTETDRQKQRQLFQDLCQQLEGLKIIGTSYRSDSLQPIRQFIGDKFNDLISQIRSNDQSLGLTSLPNPVFNTPHLIHQSRYRDDFEDLGLIEAGGFGVVNRAKYRFDDCEYAVKMIRFKYTDNYDTIFKKIIREVTLYANLSSHPNVVAYKTAWLENWCLHRERLPLSKHIKTSEDNQMLTETTGDLYSQIVTKDNENDVSIRFEESSKSGLRIESSEQQMTRTRSQTLTMEYRKGAANGTDDYEDEDMSSDEDSSDSNSSAETSKLQSFNDLSAIRGPVVSKRKKTISMCSTQSHSDTAIEYRNCFELQKYRKQDIPDIKVEADYQTNDCPFSCSDFGAILYIQMELCGKNLKTWLRERNDNVFAKLAEEKRKAEELQKRQLLSPKDQTVKEDEKEKKMVSLSSVMDFVNIKEVKNIFRQVLKGVEYIHSQHLIHRDLKPQNILFSIDGSKVKIGDFGLATLHNSIDSEVISIRDLYNKQSTSTIDPNLTPDQNCDLNHTGNIGTSVYASPEQKSRKDYDNKTDLFSLGLILFELFYPLTTEMEKIKWVNNITNKQELPKSLLNSFPNVAKIILQLTHRKPGLRPTASEVLQSSMFLREEQLIIKQMEEQNKQFIKELDLKDNKIRELEDSLEVERRINAEKDLEIEELRKQLEVMNEKIKYFT